MGAPAASRPAARGPRALFLPRGECWLEGLRELRNGARGPFAGGGRGQRKAILVNLVKAFSPFQNLIRALVH